MAGDHLANERTFLAWARTALAVIGLGVFLGKLADDDGVVAKAIGLAWVGFGAAVLVYSILRFEHAIALLDANKFEPARWGPLALAALGFVVAIGSVMLLAT